MSVHEHRAEPILDPASFLRRVHPFDLLSEKALRATAGRIQIMFFEKGTQILLAAGEPSQFLHIIRKGAVRLERPGEPVLHLADGETFGYPSLLSGSATSDAIADEDVLLYSLPGDVFRQLLREHPGFGTFFTTALAHRLARARRTDLPQAVDFHMPVEALISRDPVIVPADATVRQAAEVMQKEGVSSCLVEATPRGILTDRDLRNRVLAQGRGPETPVREVATFPLYSVPPDSPVYDTWIAMLERGIKHVAVEREGRIVGLVTATDLMRHHTHGPLLAFKRIARMVDRGALGGYAQDLARLVDVLLTSGLEATRIARLVSRLNDAVVRRILEWAQGDLGPPPQSFAWVVFGSEGRLEQTLLTDQDNALIWEQENADDRHYFEQLAARVIEDLLTAGFPECPGGFMATRWRGPLDEWKERFSTWITTPVPEALLKASIFFDLRVVAGTLDLEPVFEVIGTARAHSPFLAHLAHSALEFRPPLTLLRRLKEEGGEIDLKRGGLMPIVGLARAYGLAAGSRTTRTVSRLEAAAEAGLIGREEAETLAEGYRFLMQIRLREQLRSLRSGKSPDHGIPVSTLSASDRHHLKDVFVAVQQAQAAASWFFHTGKLG
jgi:CBS domain-containing protein